MGHENICTKREMNPSRCLVCPFLLYGPSLISPTDVGESSMNTDKWHLKPSQNRSQVCCLRVLLWSPRHCSFWAGPTQKLAKVNSSDNLQKIKEGSKGSLLSFGEKGSGRNCAHTSEAYGSDLYNTASINIFSIHLSHPTCTISLLFHFVLPHKADSCMQDFVFSDTFRGTPKVTV